MGTFSTSTMIHTAQDKGEVVTTNSLRKKGKGLLKKWETVFYQTDAEACAFQLIQSLLL